MIIFGSRATHLRSQKMPTASCPNCKTKGSLTASIFSKHAHVFWIPTFPMGRTGVFECQNCHMGFKKKSLGDDAKLEYKNINGTVKTPIWKFSGLALLAILIGFVIYSGKMKDEKVAEYVQNPAMYDTYTFKTESNYYSTFKIVEVFKDSIYVNYNTHETDKLSGVRKIDLKKNYENQIYVLTNAEINSMFDAGHIENIDR